jgi:exopolysaccharide production protein ExoQ
VTAPDSLAGRARLSNGSYEAPTATGLGAPSKAESWFAYVVLLATAVIPALEEKYKLLNQTDIQMFWSAAYAIAGWRLLLMRGQILPLVRRCAALWALLLLMFVTALWSVDPQATIIDSIELLGTTLIGLYIATRFTLLQFLKIVAVVFATAGCLSLVLVFINPGWSRADWGAGPWQGIYIDKNLFGAAASLAIISQTVLFLSVKGRERWLVAAGILLSGTLLIESNSATAFGNCIVVILAALVASACRSSRFGGFARFATVLGAAMALSAIVIFGLTPDSVFSALGREPNLSGRTDFWPYLQQAVADRPLLGFGYDAFFQSAIGSDYLTAYIVQAGGWTPYHAHNSYLQTLLDAGYVGLAVLIVLLVISAARAIAYFARERSVVSIWPLTIILFLSSASYTETYYLNFNTLESILFVAAIVYPLQRSAAVTVVARIDGRKRNDKL